MYITSSKVPINLLSAEWTDDQEWSLECTFYRLVLGDYKRSCTLLEGEVIGGEVEREDCGALFSEQFIVKILKLIKNSFFTKIFNFLSSFVKFILLFIVKQISESKFFQRLNI